ncbi:MAG: heavy metal translocating P-type ATPase [Polyangiaceae bacterium]|nr:heavy metal translocating P-type ATPase [Polyangiaceae bacterium]
MTSPPKTTEQAGNKPSRVVFRIDNLDCATEESLLRNALSSLPEVKELGFDLMKRELTVDHTFAGASEISQRIIAIGMVPALLDGNAQRKNILGADVPGISKGVIASMVIAGVAAIGAEVVAYVTGAERSVPVMALAVLAIALSGRDTLRKGWIALKNLTLNINLLMTVAVIGAVLIGQWPEAAMVIWLFSVAELIERLSLDRARNAIRSLIALAPEVANVEVQGRFVETPVEQAALDQRVQVRPGERIAFDGTVESGASAVNQAPITGESMPVEKTVGDTVFAGTINESGVLVFRVTRVKGESTLDRIARSVQDAQASRAPTQRFVDNFARIYTPVMFLISLLVAIVPPLLFAAAWYPWIYKALVILVIACPCALVISTPVTVVSGLAAAARRGILIKGGLYLEQGRHLKSIALDKTGTLTVGKPALTDVLRLSELGEDEALKISASLDSLSQHPVATAIVRGFHENENAGALYEVTEFASITGRGVQGTVAGRNYSLGNHRLAEELKRCRPEVEQALVKLEDEGKSTVVLMDETRALAVLAVADRVRDNSKDAVSALRNLGVEPVMLTGDNQRTATSVALAVGITDARGDQLPETKLQAIEELLKKGPVGMVGDGVNDAPALARCSIGFAMGAAGTDTAIETADVALMEDDLQKIPEFILLSKRTAAILWQNITFALLVKAVFFALTFAGNTSLWLAVFADLGASLLVVFNGLRLLRR